MGQSLRLFILMAAWFICIHVYQVTWLFVDIPDYCWQPYQFWLNDGSLRSPFWAFTAIFALLSAWSLVECAATIHNRKYTAFRIGFLASTLPLLAACAVMQFVLWQNLQVGMGTMSSLDAWLPGTDKDWVAKQLQWQQESETRAREWQLENPELPGDYRDFVTANSCALGKDRTALSPSELETLDAEFAGVWETHYEEEAKQQIWRSLLEHYHLN